MSDSISVINMRKIQIQTESDDVEIYVFIAHNKGELPPIHFDHLKVTVPLDNIQNVSVAVNLLKGGMDEMSDTNKPVHEKNTSIDAMIETLEKYFNDLTLCDKIDLYIVLETENTFEDCKNVIDNKVD